MARYRIEEHLASGGMGEVYRARLVSDSGATKRVALKLVRGELAERDDFSTMFVDEARVAMTLSHANVVQAFDVGRVNERWFIAMEYVDGPTLGQLARAHRQIRGAPMPVRLAVTSMVEALKGLDYAHRQKGDDGSSLGFVHRDVSPGNVLVSREGEVKITDFGIAKSELTPGESNAATIKGKIAYMAPEQLRGERVDPRADVYAAGVVLYELIAGRRPYDGKNQLALAPDVLDGRRPRLSNLRPGIDEDLEAIVDRAMATARDRRFASAAAMRQALESLAMKRGWLLSTTDIADMIEELEEDAKEGGASPTAEPKAHTGIATFRDQPVAADFDLRLGAELRRVSSDEPVSIFMTGVGDASPSDTRVETPRPPSVTPTVPEASASRRRWWLGGAAMTVVLVAGVVVIRLYEIPTTAETVDETSIVPTIEPVSPSLLVTTSPDEPEATEATEAGPREIVSRGVEVEETVERPGPRPRRRAAMSGPQAAQGALWVASDPWGWVYIDGDRVGRTTLRDHPIATGRHEVVVRNPATGLEKRQTIRVEAGETERLSLTLSGVSP